MKIKFDSDDELPLKLYNMVIVVRSFFIRETNTEHKHKDDDKDKNKNKKLISSCIDDDKLSKNIKPFGLRLETYKALNECFTSL